jgi:MFS family permease
MRPDRSGDTIRSGYRFTIIAAAALGLVWLGDALIYVVLPLYPASFGVDITTVGVLLAVNRVVRILGYGWVAPLSRRFGANALTAGACAMGALSTLAYGLVSGLVPLLIARLAWGGAYGVINLTNMAYAYGDGKNPGKRMGINRAVSLFGPVFALGAGGWLVTQVGPLQVFIIYGLIGLLAVPLALRLPVTADAREREPAPAEHRWRPNPLNILFFVIALGADGVFTATLSTLLAEVVSVSQALIGAGLLLALQRLISLLLSFCSGPLIDRFSPRTLLVPASIVVAAGLATIAAGHIYAGATILILSRPLLAVVGPILAAQRAPNDRINAMAAYATWSDTGLALGPLIGTLALARVGFGATYVLLAITIVAALGWHAVANRPAAQEADIA